MSKQGPMLSICMITYNQMQYIEKAIDGILMQQFDYGDIEFIISEDYCSQNSETIIRNLVDNYSGNIEIKYTKHPKNIGMMSNFLWTLKQAKGKYIALCEGDDYWTDKFKIQKQVHFMENNPEFSFCFHLDEILKEREIDYEIYSEPIKEPTTEDLINTHFIPSESLLFRNILKNSDYQLINIAGSGDIPLVIQLSLYGRGYLIEECMSVYRLHPGGVTGQVIGTFQRHLKNIEYYKVLNNITANKYEKQFIDACNSLYSNCIEYRNSIDKFKDRSKFTLKLIGHIFKNFITRKQLFELLKQIN